MRLGAVDFLLKPFHDGELEQAVLTLQKNLQAQSAHEIVLPKKGGQSRYVLSAMDYICLLYTSVSRMVAASSRLASMLRKMPPMRI